MKFIYSFLTFICFCCYSALSQPSTEIIKEGFNSSNMDVFRSDKKWSTMHANDWFDLNKNGKVDSFELFKKVSIVPDPTNPGNKVLSIVYHRIPTDIYMKYKDDRAAVAQMRRAEIGSARDREHKYEVMVPHHTYDFNFKIYIPSNGFEFEKNVDNSRDIVAQFHEVNSEDADSPPLSLQIRGDHWYIGINRARNKEEMDYIDLGPVERDKWFNWEFKVKVSDTNDGQMEIKKDNAIVYSENNKPNISNSSVLMYFRIGVYKPDWWRKPTTTTLRTLYYDDVSLSKMD